MVKMVKNWLVDRKKTNKISQDSFNKHYKNDSRKKLSRYFARFHINIHCRYDGKLTNLNFRIRKFCVPVPEGYFVCMDHLVDTTTSLAKINI